VYMFLQSDCQRDGCDQTSHAVVYGIEVMVAFVHLVREGTLEP
jgi:hypothetical protein